MKLQPENQQKLRRVNVGPWGVAFMLYCLVASGAFGIEEMIPASGPGMTLVMLAVLPFVWALPICSLIAECNAILPLEGGIYAWVREAFGEFWGFQAGWWNAIALYICVGTYISLSVSYIGQILTLGPVAEFLVKFILIAIFAAINLAGLKEVDAVSTVLSILVIIAFACVTAVGFATWQTNPFDPFIAPDETPMDSIANGLSIGVWMYCGYETIANMSGEISDKRHVGAGLKLVMPLIALTYILPTVAALGSLDAGTWADWSVDIDAGGQGVGYATVLLNALGPVSSVIFVVVAIASNLAIFNTTVTGASRSLFVLADDNLFPRVIGKVDKKGRSPYISIVTVAISALIFSQLDFTTLVDIEIVFILTLYMILSVTAVKLRRMYPIAERREQGLYVIRGGKVGFGLCVALPFVISVLALVMEGAEYAPMAAGALLSGVAAYVIFKMIYGGLTAKDPKRYPRNPKSRLAVGDGKRIGLFLVLAAALVGLIVVSGF